MTAEAHAMAGTLNFEASNETDAIDHFAQAAKDLRKAPADLVRYRYAVCLQRQGRWSEARREFGTLVQRYPSGDIGENARHRWSGRGCSCPIRLRSGPRLGRQTAGSEAPESGLICAWRARRAGINQRRVVCIGDARLMPWRRVRRIRAAEISDAVIA
mgnify:CR=1 FL=1